MEVKMKQLLQVVSPGFLLEAFLQGKEYCPNLFLNSSSTDIQENLLSSIPLVALA